MKQPKIKSIRTLMEMLDEVSPKENNPKENSNVKDGEYFYNSFKKAMTKSTNKFLKEFAKQEKEATCPVLLAQIAQCRHTIISTAHTALESIETACIAYDVHVLNIDQTE